MTPEQENTIKELKQMGYDDATARDRVLGVNDKGIDNIWFGEGSLTQSIGKGVREATIGTVEHIQEDIDKYGVAPTVAKSPLAFFAGAGRGVAEVAGGFLETADDLTDEVVSDALKPAFERAVQSDAGQKTLEVARAIDEKTYGVAGDLFDITGLLGVTAVAKSGTAKSIKNSLVNASKKSLEKSKTPVASVKNIFKKADDIETPKILKTKTKVEYQDQALKASAELLQSGSKKSAKGRSAKYNNADVQAMEAIRDSKVPLKSQQDLADFFDDSVSVISNERDALLKPSLHIKVDNSFLKPIKDEALKLQKAGDSKVAGAYAKMVAEETRLFDKVAKASSGGKATVEYISNRVKEINKKVNSLFDEVGGKENLLPEQKLEVQAYDLIRQGLKGKLDDIGGDAYKELGTKVSGLIDARQFARIQRDRAKNALTDVPWEAMGVKDRMVFIKDHFPTIKDIGVKNLVKLDTKSDVIDGLVEAKVRQIRLFGNKATASD